MEEIKSNEQTKTIIVNEASAREHLANERTLLAWIRTSIGIMAFGFVVVKFSLFIKQISLLVGSTAKIPPSQGYSSIIGIPLVALGATVLLFSYIKFKQTQKQLNEGKFQSSSKLIFLLVIIIFFISVLLITYLIENTSSYY